MSKRLWIIRGLPGSGKTTLAHFISAGVSKYGENHRVCEADAFMVNDELKYEFDPSKLEECHTRCRLRAENGMKIGIENVIVSNTFTQIWEAEPYIQLAFIYGYDIQVIECAGNFGNVHGVPEKKIEQMKRRWERTDALISYIKALTKELKHESMAQS